jgi:hypothetical protein
VCLCLWSVSVFVCELFSLEENWVKVKTGVQAAVAQNNHRDMAQLRWALRSVRGMSTYLERVSLGAERKGGVRLFCRTGGSVESGGRSHWHACV